jgi:LmbE family N-acetylglucosaminyl deacetylase
LSLDGLAQTLMLNFGFNLPRGRQPHFLFIGAHSDDIEIGCGGTVMELLAAYPRARVSWVVLSSEGRRDSEARRSATLYGRGKGRFNVIVKNFRGAFFPAEFVALKEFFEELKALKPDVVFTHCREELHQDHRIVGELSWNTFRDHAMFEYEIPKFDGGLGSPQFFVPVSAKNVERKIALLMKIFATQRSKRWFTPETFRGLMRLRGIECNAPDGYAEAYYARKVVLAARGVVR